MEVAKAWASASALVVPVFWKLHVPSGNGNRLVRRTGCIVVAAFGALMQTGFETLVEAGYNPVNAYFE